MIDITLRLEKDHMIWNWLESQENKSAKLAHVGTHADVYKKSHIPLEYFKTRGILIDCANYDLNEQIGMESLKDISIEEKSFVIFKTNMIPKYPYGSDTYMKGHPELTWELIDYLLENKVYFIGIDCAGIRKGQEHIRADIKAEENNTYVIENLDLSRLSLKTGDEFDIYTMWIENPFTTGLATRVLIDIE